MAVQINSEKLQRQLANILQHGERAYFDALRALSFNARDAAREDVARALHWSSPQTQRFITRGITISYRREGTTFRARIYPRKKSAEFLERHTGGHVNRPGDSDLHLRGDRVAIPLERMVPRGRTGKVPGRLRPVALLERKSKRSRGFINRPRTALLWRKPGGDVEVAYVLRPQTANPKRVDVGRSVREHVRRHAGRAFAEVVRRRIRAAGVR